MGPMGVMALFLAIIILPQAIKVIKESERAVTFRFGRYIGIKGPGLIFLIPVVDQISRVDLRVVTLDVPAQEVITKDNVTIKVNAVVFFRVVTPENAIIKVEDFVHATSLYAQTTLRSTLGRSELDELLAHRDKINVQLQEIIDEITEGWGIKVTSVEIKDVELPQTMQRAMAKQAEAEREKRAKVIHAEGEKAAAQSLADAADILSRNPAAIQMRYLQTLTEIAIEKNSTILFPVPIDTMKSFLEPFMREQASPAGIAPPQKPAA
jgi:regulator of protease activity HflC (stomatin/prohibitin superfamily)